MPSAAADRNLLFGILALQMDFIAREALIAGMHAWVLDKAKSLGQVLQEQGALQANNRLLLDALVQRHLEMHNNDPQQSLAAVSSLGSVRHDLRQVADPDVQASLVQAGTDHSATDPDATSAHVGAGTLPPHARFLILRPHARGGLGEVFVARDEELDREVALKEIQQRHAGQPESRARFLMEAKVTGALEHPGIVPVYGLGAYADGRPFYAMRFIKGDSLKEAIAAFHAADRGERPESERSLALRGLLGRFVDVCQAIAYAHSRGVLHRDLKPGNVMLGKYGETLVVDWGLAKVLGQGDVETTEAALVRPGDSGLTQAGRALGTPAYMSPEQAAGRLDQLGPASDVYSLGATLYCLLTGQTPFGEGDAGAVLGKVQKGDFPPPREVNPRVPAALEAVCLKAMALRPQDRYASPRELAGEVEHWLADEPVAAHRERWPARLARGMRKRPALTAGVGALLATGVLALAVSTLLIAGAQRETEKALRNEEQARRERVLAQLGDAAPGAVPGILADLEANPDEVLPRLHERRAQEGQRRKRMRLALALLSAEPEAVRDELGAWLLEAEDPAEVLLVRDVLKAHSAGMAPGLWRKAGAAGTPARQRFRALVALAAFDPDSRRWKNKAPGLVGELLSANPLHLGAWVQALRPVRGALLEPLGKVFRRRDAAGQHQAAAQVLADYAFDRPALLAGLLLDADAKQYAVLWPVLGRYPEEATARMRKELAASPDYWKDAPLDRAWKAPAAELRREVEQAGGLFTERFALCQALPLERLRAVTEGLRPAGYRPVRVRPWSAPLAPPPLLRGGVKDTAWPSSGRATAATGGWKRA
jgi:tRNA A-37 threonylcarbamoyl transferase component Bud32